MGGQVHRVLDFGPKLWCGDGVSGGGGGGVMIMVVLVVMMLV